MPNQHPQWPELHVAQMRALYATLGPGELAARLGRNKKAVESMAQRMGLRFDNRFSPLFKESMDLIKARTQEVDGLDVCSLPRDRRAYVGQIVVNMVTRGQLFKAKLSHKTVRYFSTQEAADAYLQRNRRREYRNEAYVPTWKAGKAWWDAAAPMVITDKTKITRIPTPPRALRTSTHSEVA